MGGFGEQIRKSRSCWDLEDVQVLFILYHYKHFENFQRKIGNE